MKYMLRVSDHTYLNLDVESYVDPAVFLHGIVDTLLNAKVYTKYSETFEEAKSFSRPRIELLIVPDNRLASKEKEDEKEV